jgi:hypothetical protein
VCGKSYGGCWVLLPLHVFGCVSVVVVEGAVSGIAGGWGCVQFIQQASQQVVSM